MIKKLGAKPIIYPQPVFIIGTYDSNNNPDAMNAAWGGIADNDKIFICMGDNHQTTKNLILNKELSVSIGTKEHVLDCDYVGIESAIKNPNKLKNTSLTPVKCPDINAPYFKELPLCFECKVESYDKESCYLFLKVVDTLCDDSILKSDGKIDVKKLDPIIYDGSNHKYYSFGEVVGDAFKDGLKLKK